MSNLLNKKKSSEVVDSKSLRGKFTETNGSVPVATSQKGSIEQQTSNSSKPFKALKKMFSRANSTSAKNSVDTSPELNGEKSTSKSISNGSKGKGGVHRKPSFITRLRKSSQPSTNAPLDNKAVEPSRNITDIDQLTILPALTSVNSENMSPTLVSINTTASPMTHASSTPPKLRIIPGVTGIPNHGNTCYINSVVQCLSHVDLLARKLLLFDCLGLPANQQHHQGRSVQGFRRESIGSKRKDLTESFIRFLQSLWKHDGNRDVSMSFKNVLGSYRSEYKTREQQDAQELLLFLLNTLHEELNTAPTSTAASSVNHTEPPVARKRSIAPTSPEQAALEMEAQLEEFRSRNQSLIYELCAGFQQSAILCPGCKGQFSRPELFYCLSLPIPTREMKPVFVTHVSIEGERTCYCLTVKTVDSVADLRSSLSHRLGVPSSHLLLTELTRRGFGRTFLDQEPITVLIDVAVQPHPITSSEASSCNSVWEGLFVLELPQPELVDREGVPLNQIPPGSRRKVNSQTGYVLNGGGGPYRSLSPGAPLAQSESCHVNGVSPTLAVANGYHPVACHHGSDVVGCDHQNGDNENANYIRIVYVHVEQTEMLDLDRSNGGVSNGEDAIMSQWSRFTGPSVIQVARECSLSELSSAVMTKLIPERPVYHRPAPRFWVMDGIKGKCELEDGVEFPLISECVDRALNWNQSGGGIRHLKLVVLWWRHNQMTSSVLPEHQLLVDVSVDEVTRQFPSGRATTAPVTIQDCLEAYMTDEELSMDDSWLCPTCRRSQQATVKTSLITTPDLLVVQLKRFVQSSMPRGHFPYKRGANGSRVNNKLEIMVRFPVEGLDMRPYLDPTAKNSGSGQRMQSNQGCLYDLVGVCNHSGSLSGGHYVALCRSSVDAKWRMYNDDKVEIIPSKEVVQHNAYILFYQRRSSLPQPDQIGLNHWSYWNLSFSPDVIIAESRSKGYRGAPPQLDRQKAEPPKSDPPCRRHHPVHLGNGGTLPRTPWDQHNSKDGSSSGDDDDEDHRQQSTPPPASLPLHDYYPLGMPSRSYNSRPTSSAPSSANNRPVAVASTGNNFYRPAQQHSNRPASTAVYMSYQQPIQSQSGPKVVASNGYSVSNIHYQQQQRPQVQKVYRPSAVYSTDGGTVLQTGKSTIRIPVQQNQQTVPRPIYQNGVRTNFQDYSR